MSTSHKIKIEIKYIENNVYYKDNPKFFLELKYLVEEHPCHASRMLKYTKHELMHWIDSQLPLLQDDFYQISTKVNWILNGRIEFPICPICNKDDNYKTKNLSITTQYSESCCIDCKKKNPAVKERSKLTCLERYGVEYTFLAQSVKDKIKETNLEQYGVENPSQSNVIQERKTATWLEKYGVAHPFAAKEVKDKIKETNLERYGAENPFGSNIIKDKIKETNILRYGTESPMQNNEIRSKNALKYTYNGIHFDSKPEIALYIWLIDNNIKFEYLPNIRFEYFFNGQKHIYLPDFKINDTIVELKGNQFINLDGKWQCPFNHILDGLFEVKHQCLLDNNVTIIYSTEYKKYLDYVSKKYGKNYLSQFRNKSKKI